MQNSPRIIYLFNTKEDTLTKHKILIIKLTMIIDNDKILLKTGKISLFSNPKYLNQIFYLILTIWQIIQHFMSITIVSLLIYSLTLISHNFIIPNLSQLSTLILRLITKLVNIDIKIMNKFIKKEILSFKQILDKALTLLKSLLVLLPKLIILISNLIMD
jgi:hypothetical protein